MFCLVTKADRPCLCRRALTPRHTPAQPGGTARPAGDDPGQAILATGQFKVPIQVVIPEDRYPLYTTKPQEVLAMQQAAQKEE